MKQSILTCLLLVCFSLLYSQGSYNLAKIGLEEIQLREHQHESVLIDTIEFGITLANFAGDHVKTKTLIYKRVNDDFSPKLHVWYHLDTHSEDLLGITYNWDFYNPGFNPDKNRDLLFATAEREAEYKQLYDSLIAFLNKEIGPYSEVNLISDNDFSFNEMIYWENDKLYAYARMNFKRTIQEIPVLGLASNHFAVQMVLSFKNDQ